MAKRGAVAAGAYAPGLKRSSPGREAWRRLIRNKTAVVGMVLILLLIILAVFADVIAPYGYAESDYSAMNQTPSLQHLFGTDNMGRDLFSRCVYGTRYSLPVGVVCVITSLLLGGILGSIAAYFGGRVDNVIMRFMDIFQAIPATLLAIAIVAVMGNGIGKLIFAITIAFMPGCSKICRSAIFTVKNNEFVTSSRALGAGGATILIRHMLPNAVGPIIIDAVGRIASAILTVSTLSYLGLGVVAPTPEWGSLLSAGKDYIRSYPHLVLFPGLMIMVTVFAFNLFGDGLRDALDPRLK